jgi:hypothetical protein
MDWIAVILGVINIFVLFGLAKKAEEFQTEQKRRDEEHQNGLAALSSQHDRVMHELTHHSALELELFRRRLEVVGDFWLKLTKLRDAAVGLFRIGYLIPEGADPKKVEVDQYERFIDAADGLLTSWHATSPLLAPIRGEVDGLIVEVEEKLKEWFAAREVSRQTGGADQDQRVELLKDVIAARSGLQKWANTALPEQCDSIFVKLSGFVESTARRTP